MEVSLKRDPTLRLRIACFYRRLVIEPVAIVPLCAVLRPWSHANPAEPVLGKDQGYHHNK